MRPPLSTLTPQARSHGHANALLVFRYSTREKEPTGSLLGTRQESTRQLRARIDLDRQAPNRS
jgi:hypothetical protein